MLKNAPILAIRGVDTEENEPSKVSMKWGSQTGVAPVISGALFVQKAFGLATVGLTYVFLQAFRRTQIAELETQWCSNLNSSNRSMRPLFCTSLCLRLILRYCASSASLSGSWMS